MIVYVHPINGDCHEIRGPRDVIVDIGPDAEPGPAEIVLLTHDDEDHVGRVDKASGRTRGKGGALAYFQRTPGCPPESRQGLSPRGLWVPYEWGVIARVIVAVANSNYELNPNTGRSQGEGLKPLELLTREVERVDDDCTDEVGSIESGVRQLWPPEGFEDEEVRAETKSVSGEATKEGLAQASTGDQRVDDLAGRLDGLNGIDDIGDIGQVAGRVVDYFDVDTDVGGRMKDTAHRTVSILKAAHERGWRIRFFNHCDGQGCQVEHWKSVGEPGVLTMIAAKEMHLTSWSNIRDPERQIFLAGVAMFLTIWNVRSLASYAWRGLQPPYDAIGGMLFWADARGPEGHSLPCFTASTAPHHGSASKEHGAAWREINAAEDYGPVAVISTYNSSVSGPPDDFIQKPRFSRACVSCWRRRSMDIEPLPQAQVVDLEAWGDHYLTPCPCPPLHWPRDFGYLPKHCCRNAVAE